MIKTILVRASGDESDSAAYAATRCIARRFGAHIDGLHVRLDPVELAVAMSTEGAGGTLLQGIIDSLERDADAGEAKARARFMAFCSDADFAFIADPAKSVKRPSAMLHVETGQVARWMCAYGRTSDLIIASRGVPGGDAVARSTLEATLLETGRPLLIPAAAMPAPELADRIAIAWKATPEAARALAFAMPFLAHATEVTILTVDEDDGQRDEGARLVRYLGWHGITARSERLTAGSKGAAATLLTAAKAHSGLLVMGGYGHTRLREWVFGGFTQYALDQAELPVLMAH
ncbi:MAG TPA: universal stress protein [Stellaceae bacterium]|nr:universal stress protein [Stellaceae bacterium]